MVNPDTVPSDDEALAAISAAFMMLASGSGADQEMARPAAPGWRFSGRWWATPTPLARPRPW
ncbi:MAG: hypothetical protein M0000_05200 [Actinomycetota bacterium]|nr:hypothetical protein [Actinomycetota bacterium]